MVNAYVTTPEIGKEKSNRLFLSTIDAEDIQIDTTRQEEKQLHDMTEEMRPYLPLFLYQFRWNIEVGYYESKSFWSLGNYMLRSRKGIELLVNMIGISYGTMKILPYQEAGLNDQGSFLQSHKKYHHLPWNLQVKNGIHVARVFSQPCLFQLKSCGLLQCVLLYLLLSAYKEQTCCERHIHPHGYLVLSFQRIMKGYHSL